VDPVLGRLVLITALCIPMRESCEKTSLHVPSRAPVVIETLLVLLIDEDTSDLMVESDIHEDTSPAVGSILKMLVWSRKPNPKPFIVTL
jgi:hypothetical protein